MTTPPATYITSQPMPYYYREFFPVPTVKKIGGTQKSANFLEQLLHPPCHDWIEKN